jgi:hypothetical protein
MFTRKKTIDSVLAVARTVVADLDTLALEHKEIASSHADEILHLQNQVDEHVVEAERATTLAKKWSELV